MMGFLALLAFGLIILLIPQIGERIQMVLTGNDEAWQIRLTNWTSLWPSGSTQLLLGSGGGTGGAMTISFHDSGNLADNQYLALLIQFGIVGIFIYVGLLISGPLVGFFKHSKTNFSHNGNLEMAGLLVVSLTGLFGGVVNVLNAFPVNMYFWCALALVASRGGGEANSIVRRPNSVNNHPLLQCS